MNWLKGYDAWKLASPYDSEPNYTGFEIEYPFDELPIKCGEASPLMVNGLCTLIGDSNTFYADHIVLDSFFGDEKVELSKRSDEQFWKSLARRIADEIEGNDYVEEWFAQEHRDWLIDREADAADHAYDAWKERDL